MVGQSPEGELVQGTVFDGSSDSIQFMCGQLHMLDVLMDGDREELFSRWELAEVIGYNHVLAGLILYCVMVLLHE